MYTQFRQFLSKIGHFSESEFDLIVALTRTQKIKKRFYLLQEGDVCNHTAWIATGCVRLFLEDSNHREHNLSFGFEGDFVADRESLISRLPSKCNIEALEDTEVILVSPEAVDELLTKVPVMLASYLRATRELLARSQGRLIASLTLPAEEKFLLMHELCPQALQRVPLHMIASFLGMTPATLSRIRSKHTAEAV